MFSIRRSFLLLVIFIFIAVVTFEHVFVAYNAGESLARAVEFELPISPLIVSTSMATCDVLDNEEFSVTQEWTATFNGHLVFYRKAYYNRESGNMAFMVMFGKSDNEDEEVDVFCSLNGQQWVKATLSLVLKHRRVHVGFCRPPHLHSQEKPTSLLVARSQCPTTRFRLPIRSSVLSSSSSSSLSKLSLCLKPEKLSSLDALSVLEWVVAHRLLHGDVHFVLYYHSTTPVSEATLNFLKATFKPHVELVKWNNLFRDEMEERVAVFNHCLISHFGKSGNHQWLLLSLKEFLVPNMAPNLNSSNKDLKYGVGSHYLIEKSFVRTLLANRNQMVEYLDTTRLMFRHRSMANIMLPMVVTSEADDLVVISDTGLVKASNINATSNYYTANPQLDGGKQTYLVTHKYPVEDLNVLNVNHAHLVNDSHLANYLYNNLNEECMKLNIALSFYEAP